MTPQTPPTDRPLTAGDVRMMEQIAHNLCSLHDFDVALVAGLERFAKAVITEYERARPATSAASEGEMETAWRILEAIPAINDLGSQYQEDIQSAILTALRSNTREAVAWRYRYPNDTAWQLTQDHDQAFKNTGEVEPLGVIPFPALASPPVSERERELEGALRHYACSCEPVHCAMSDDDSGTPVDDALCGRVAALALTAQPAGEGK